MQRHPSVAEVGASLHHDGSIRSPGDVKSELIAAQPETAISGLQRATFPDGEMFCLVAGIERLGVWWAKGLVYAIIPVTVTFVILYRSGWRRETPGRARIGSLLLLACVIFGGVMLAVCVMVSLAWFGSIAMRAGLGGR